MPRNEIEQNPELNIWEALLPVIVLVLLLSYNVFVFGDNALSGSNQFILLIGGGVAAVVGYFNKVSYKKMLEEIGENFKSTAGAILILLFVGSLVGAWLLSGIIPAMIYYGLKLLNAQIFLPASIVIACIISLGTGSSWATTATVGVALIGIGKAIGIPAGMVAGAVVSGAYFGDKMSPLSDTTNLAPAIAGSELFDHIKYMSLTTIPTISITLIIFIFLGLAQASSGPADLDIMLSAIDSSFNIHWSLFLVPLAVIGMIIIKTKPVVALLAGSLLGAVWAIFFQPDLVALTAGVDSLSILSAYKGVMIAMTEGLTVDTGNAEFADLFSAGGMSGMMNTVWLVLCALVFGGVMEAIGALARISAALLSLAHSVFGLFASTVASCLALNVTASDQYLAIVVPGKMFSQAYKERGLAPENLSRTLEDSGTVTSVLVPWNTCGAYQSSVLGVSVADYFVYAIFNYLSPFMTLLYAAMGWKIKTLLNGGSRS